MLIFSLTGWLGHLIFSRLSCYYNGVFGQSIEDNWAIKHGFPVKICIVIFFETHAVKKSCWKRRIARQFFSLPSSEWPCLTSMGLVGQHEQKEWKGFHKKLVVCLKQWSTSGFDELVFLKGQVERNRVNFVCPWIWYWNIFELFNCLGTIYTMGLQHTFCFCLYFAHR